MKIQCLQKREGGSLVNLGNIEYRFLPDAIGRHVCEVIDQAHIERFIAISEGYLALVDAGDTATGTVRKNRAKAASEDQSVAHQTSRQGDESGATD